VDEWFERAADLSYVELSMDPSEDKELGEGYIVQLLPYDRIVDQYNIKPGSQPGSKNGGDKPEEVFKRSKKAEAEAEDDSGGDDTEEIGSRLSRARNRRSRRK
jgi:hypothetical protein